MKLRRQSRRPEWNTRKVGGTDHQTSADQSEQNHLDVTSRFGASRRGIA
jgi:hypothetical protein